MKERLLTISFIAILCIGMLATLLHEPYTISISERRKLNPLPPLTTENVGDGSYMNELERYLTEQFPMRDSFRKLKSFSAQVLFQFHEEDGYVVEENAIYELHPTLNEASIRHLTTLIQTIKERHITSPKCYFALIPDKSDYLASIPHWDRTKMIALLQEQLPSLHFIDLYDTLSLSSYYPSDLHWRQTDLNNTLYQLVDTMNLPRKPFPTQTQCMNNFYGAYYGRIAHRLDADTLCWLTNDEINQASVYDYEQNRYRSVYEEDDLSHMDAYDLFLGGAKPLLIIHNKEQNNGRELLLFRDSFASSITPLLIPYYEKITMIDLRYLSSDYLNRIAEITFTNEQDVLFLYSSAILNQSTTMK